MMTEEIEVVPETNGEATMEADTSAKEALAETGDKKDAEANNDKETAAADDKKTNKENGEKTTEEVEKLSGEELDAAIIRQVEYYFGDSNLPRDKFLREQILLDEGWVPIEVLTRFNRLSKLTLDIDVIESALKKSTSGLIEVENKKVRRNPELPIPEMNEERRLELLKRTIYAKGFPKDITLDALLKFFKQFDEVENVIMRRYLDKRVHKKFFKGSIFVTFKTKEQAEKFVEQKGLKYGDTELLILWQDDYLKQKQEEISNRKSKKDKKGNKEAQDDATSKPDFKLPAGTVLHFEKGSGTLTREDIKSAILEKDKDIEVAYIDHKLGLEKGSIRFAKENAAKEFIKLLEDGNLKVKDSTLVLKTLDEEEEKQYLDKIIDEMSKKRKQMKNFSKFKGKSNFRGKYGKKRRADNNGDGPPAKVKADS